MSNKPKLGRVVLVTKSTCKENHAGKPDISNLHPELAQAAQGRADIAHEQHYATLEQVVQTLNRRSLNYRRINRDDPNYMLPAGTDLVITVGGDGTFLSTSHFISARQNTLILGVNSSMSTSVGHYCLANQDNFRKLFGQVVSGKLQPLRLLRLGATLNGEALPLPVLNEITITDEKPIAGTARYTVLINGVAELQSSFGMIISTPAGSTGSYCSAGGKVLNIADRQFGYVGLGVIRQPGKSINFAKGVLPEEGEIYIRSEMEQGKIYVDGKHLVYDFPRGSELVINTVPELDLLAFVNPDCNQPYIGLNQ